MMIEMMFKQIFNNELLDDKFCEYLKKELHDKVVDDLQIEIQVLLGDVMPRTCESGGWDKIPKQSNDIDHNYPA